MKDDSGSAFPIQASDLVGSYNPTEGMTLRQYYATHAPESPQWWRESYTAILENDLNTVAQHEAQWRFCYADAMIAEGKK